VLFGRKSVKRRAIKGKNMKRRQRKDRGKIKVKGLKCAWGGEGVGQNMIVGGAGPSVHLVNISCLCMFFRTSSVRYFSRSNL
jgi:hypothetical protein